MFRVNLKRIISVWLVYHCLVMVSAPNQPSFLNRSLQRYFLSYINVLGLHVPWDFFAPDPGPPVNLDITLMTPSGPKYTSFPDPAENVYRPQLNRRIAMARTVTKNQELLKQVYLPWLCRQYPEATDIRITATIGVLASLDEVSHGLPINDLGRKNPIGSEGSDCIAERASR